MVELENTLINIYKVNFIFALKKPGLIKKIVQVKTLHVHYKFYE